MKAMSKKAVLIVVILALSVVKSLAQIESGTCGANLTWTYDRSTGMLTISGTGDMTNFVSPPPWGFFSSSIATVVVNDGVTSIGMQAFVGCTILSSITIPNSVTNIGERAFAGCERLTSIMLPNSMTSIEGGTFERCKRLTSITIPEGVTSIERGAFLGCERLTSIMLPNSMTSIGERAFVGCTILSSIMLPDSVKSIGVDVFSSCRNLISINVTSGNTEYSSENGVLFNKAKTELICFPLGKSGDYTIPDGVTSIGDRAFLYCSGLTSITIPDGVTSIGEYAFSGCSGLTSITIPNSVTSIGDWTFSGCRFTSITIPDGVTSIGDWAFSGCTELSSITLPNSVTSVGLGAFDNCIRLSFITIPESVISIGGSAFQYCYQLISVAVNWSTPLSIPSNVFSRVSLATVRLIVPIGTKALYQDAPIWEEFQIEESGTKIDDIQTTTLVRIEQLGDELHISHPSAAIDGVEIFDINGRSVYRKSVGFTMQSISVSSWTKGVYLVVVRAGNNKMTHKFLKNR